MCEVRFLLGARACLTKYSSEVIDLDESIQTLEFAMRAKKVLNHVVENEVLSMEEEPAFLQDSRIEDDDEDGMSDFIEKLKRKVEKWEGNLFLGSLRTVFMQ